MYSLEKVTRDNKHRVNKACDRCRIKKVRCDGQVPCQRCQNSDAICHFGGRSSVDKDKNVSAEHVVHLQANYDILAQALRTLWSRYAQPQQDPSTPEISSVHDIVKALGISQWCDGVQVKLEGDPVEEFDFNSYDLSAQTSEVREPPRLPDSAIGSLASGLGSEAADEGFTDDDRTYPMDLSMYGTPKYFSPYDSDPSTASSSTSRSTSNAFDPSSEMTTPHPSNGLKRSNRPSQKLCMPRTYQDDLIDTMLKPSGLSMSSQAIMQDCYEQVAAQASTYDNQSHLTDWNQSYPGWYSADY